VSRSLTDLPQQLHHSPITSDQRGMHILPTLMELAHLSGILEVPPCSATATTIMDAIARASSLSLVGLEPASNKAYSRSYLLVSSRYVCVWRCNLSRDILHLSSFLSSKRVIYWLQEGYLRNSKCSSVGCSPDVSRPPDSGGVAQG
jgi:hypothetical protein